MSSIEQKFFAKIQSLLKKDEAKKGAMAAVTVITLDTKLSVLWEKLRPFVGALSLILPKKWRQWLKYLIIKIDAVVEAEVTEEEGDE